MISVNGQTGVVVLDSDDIADTATNRFTNDTDINRLANTSGVNTGDQTLGSFGITATATELNVLDGIPGTLTATELGYVDGVTSSIQTQLNNKIENLSAFDTDDLAEGTTNLYSQWEKTDGTQTSDYINPKLASDRLFIGQTGILPEWEEAFGVGGAAVFTNQAEEAVSYFGNIAVGTNFLTGGFFLAGYVAGSVASPQAPTDAYIGGLIFSTYDGSKFTINGSGGYVLPGIFGRLSGTPTSDTMDVDLIMGSLLYSGVAVKMRNAGQTSIVINDTSIDADTQINWDSGIAMFVQGSSGNVTVATPGTQTNAVANIDTAQTFTNKRITPRVDTTTSSATPTINTDNVDIYGLTAQTADITSFTTNLSGTPTNGQKLWIYVVGTAARAITWGSSFENGASTLPTTTVGTERLDVFFVWNAVSSKWRCMAAGSA